MYEIFVSFLDTPRFNHRAFRRTERMHLFSKLHNDLTGHPDRAMRVRLLRNYFSSVSDNRDRQWAERLLRGHAKKKFITYNQLRHCTAAYTDVPLWLIEESIQHTGRVTEAISLIVTTGGGRKRIRLSTIMDSVHASTPTSIEYKYAFIHTVWNSLLPEALYLFNRIITGTYRSPVTRAEIDRACGLLSDPRGPAEEHARPAATIRAVLLYVSRTEYTFAVRKDDTYIPIVRTNEGLRTEDHVRIRRYAADHTREKFGPVSSVTPDLIFEIACEEVVHDKRRKSGVKLVSPRVVRFCEGDTLSSVDPIEKVYDITRGNE
jgi:hypothetical protein